MDVWIRPRTASEAAAGTKQWWINDSQVNSPVDEVWLETTAHFTSDGRIHCVHSYAEFDTGPGTKVFCTVRRGRQ